MVGRGPTSMGVGMVRRVLRKYGYPPEGQDAATDLVIEQAELLGQELVA